MESLKNRLFLCIFFLFFVLVAPGLAEDLEKQDLYIGYKGEIQGETKYQEGNRGSEDFKEVGDIVSPYNIQLDLTKNFGREILSSKKVGLVKGEPALEVLFRNHDVGTAYGGGFVNAIDGIESQFTFYSGDERKKVDWFYYVNGILAPVGAGEFVLNDGDTMWWDYHDWEHTIFIPAVIGSFPEPFRSGFDGKNPGTIIIYTEGLENTAVELKKALEKEGVEKVRAEKYLPGQNYSGYTMYLGPWKEISKDNPKLKEVNERNKHMGVYTYFDKNNRINALNIEGKCVFEKNSGGAIFSFSEGIGAASETWAVTGTDLESVVRSSKILINEPSKIKNKFGVLVSKSKIFDLPFQER